MATEARYIGPYGAVFVLSPGAVDDRTLAARLESGEWKPFSEPEPEPKRVGRTRKSD